MQLRELASKYIQDAFVTQLISAKQLADKLGVPEDVRRTSAVFYSHHLAAAQCSDELAQVQVRAGSC